MRAVLRRPTYTGIHPVYQTRHERRPGGGYRERLATPEEQIALPGIAPAIVTPEEFAAVPARLDHNAVTAIRHNKCPEATLLGRGISGAGIADGC